MGYHFYRRCQRRKRYVTPTHAVAAASVVMTAPVGRVQTRLLNDYDCDRGNWVNDAKMQWLTYIERSPALPRMDSIWSISISI